MLTTRLFRRRDRSLSLVLVKERVGERSMVEYRDLVEWL
jgi:hypothetical protein